MSKADFKAFGQSVCMAGRQHSPQTDSTDFIISSRMAVRVLVFRYWFCFNAAKTRLAISSLESLWVQLAEAGTL